MTENREPRYVISIAANILGVKTHTLRYYEKVGIVEPRRSQGNIRLYSDVDLALLRRVKTLMDDLGVNLAGVEVVLRLAEQLNQAQRRVTELEAELARYRDRTD